jgi:hypothetical protein
MLAHDIPAGWTARLADALGVLSVEDLAGLSPEHVMRVPSEFRKRIIDLYNFSVPENQTHMYLSVDMV